MQTKKEIVMKNKHILLIGLLMMTVSCTEQPFGGSHHILTRSKEESKQRQMFICSYIPLDTVFEYHDSLIDIKLTMKEAYAEMGCWKLFRWPPYRRPHFKRDSTTFIFHCVFDTDPSTTPTKESSDENNWWEWSCFTGDQRPNDFWCYGECFADETSIENLDTLAFPVYFNYTYKTHVWPGFSRNECVPIGFIRFARDTADCEAFYYSIKDTVLSAAKEYVRRCIEEYHVEYMISSHNWHTVEEMNAKYKNNCLHKDD